MRGHVLTAGELMIWLKQVPPDAAIFYERVEDVYFKKHGWKPRIMPGQFKGDTSQYIPAFCVVRFRKDRRNVYITAHY